MHGMSFSGVSLTRLAHPADETAPAVVGASRPAVTQNRNSERCRSLRPVPRGIETSLRSLDAHLPTPTRGNRGALYAARQASAPTRDSGPAKSLCGRNPVGGAWLEQATSCL